jgi:hypothetical protein
MLPSGCFPAGCLIVKDNSTICIGGADIRRGTLDGLVVSVKSIPYNPTGSLNGSQEVTLDVQIQSYLAY